MRINLARRVTALLMLLTGPGEDRADRGATATEYAILVAFIALAIVLGVTFFGSTLNTWFSNLATSLHLT